MSRRRRDTRSDLLNQTTADETLAAFVLIGSQLAAKAAAAKFETVTAQSGWTAARVEADIECSISRMEIAARDAIMALGGDPDGELWHAVWTEMQRSYRATMAGLMRNSSFYGGLLQ